LESLDPKRQEQQHQQQQQQRQSSSAAAAAVAVSQEEENKDQDQDTHEQATRAKPKKSVSFPRDSLGPQAAKVVTNPGKATAEAKHSSALDRLASKASAKKTKQQNITN